MESAGEPGKNRVLMFAENHPYVLLVAVGILFVLLIITYLNSCGWWSDKTRGRRKKKKSYSVDDDEEIDELIDSIHAKQKRKKCPE